MGPKFDYVHIIERTTDFCLSCSGFLIGLIAVAVSYGALRRYAFSSPEYYSYDLSQIFSACSAALAIAGVQWFRRNVRVDFVANHLPKIVQALLHEIVEPAMGLSFVVIVAWQTWLNGWLSLQMGEVSRSVWAYPLFPIKLMVSAGFWLLSITLLVQLYRGVISLIKGQLR